MTPPNIPGPSTKSVQIRIVIGKDFDGEDRLRSISIDRDDARCLRGNGQEMVPYIQKLYDELRAQYPSLSPRKIGDKIRAKVGNEAAKTWIHVFDDL